MRNGSCVEAKQSCMVVKMFDMFSKVVMDGRLAFKIMDTHSHAPYFRYDRQ